jgi:4-aminobutyrate aminotransferase-like enzyme
VVGAAISATVAEMRRLDTPTLSAKLGERLDVELAALAGEEPLVGAATGVGCMRALHLVGADGEPMPQAEVSAVISAVRDAGAILHPGPHSCQIIPALVYSDADLDELLGAVRAGLHAHAASGEAP